MNKIEEYKLIHNEHTRLELAELFKVHPTTITEWARRTGKTYLQYPRKDIDFIHKHCEKGVSMTAALMGRSTWYIRKILELYPKKRERVKENYTNLKSSYAISKD